MGGEGKEETGENPPELSLRARRNDRWSLLLPATSVSEKSGGESGLLGVAIVEERGQRSSTRNKIYIQL